MSAHGDSVDAITTAIQTAIAEHKDVACFVQTDYGASNFAYPNRENNGEGWRIWLSNNRFREMVGDKITVLDIRAGSQAHAFLNAFVPVTTVPELMVIGDNRVKAHMKSPITREEFYKQIAKALEPTITEAQCAELTRVILDSPTFGTEDSLARTYRFAPPTSRTESTSLVDRIQAFSAITPQMSEDDRRRMREDATVVELRRIVDENRELLPRAELEVMEESIRMGQAAIDIRRRQERAAAESFRPGTADDQRERPRDAATRNQEAPGWRQHVEEQAKKEAEADKKAKQEAERAKSADEQQNSEAEASGAEASSQLQREAEAATETPKRPIKPETESTNAKATTARTPKTPETEKTKGVDPKTKAMLEQKLRREEAKAERERILKQIELDKAARKAREVEEKRSRQTKASAPPTTAAASKGKAKASDTCTLRVRLFDGATIQQRFPSTATLGKGVREWVDEHAHIKDTTVLGTHISNAPYTFKDILPPAPPRNISVGEESQTLFELGLCPNATLVLVLVQSYTEAYEGGGGVTGVVGSVTGAGVRVVSSGLGFAARTLGSFLSGGTPTPAEPEQEQPLARRSEARDPNQFYNGNSTNTEPRPKSKDGKKE